MKSFLYVGLLISMLSCMSATEKNDYLGKNDYAVIKIQVPDNGHYDRNFKSIFYSQTWRIRIVINDKILIKKYIKGGGESQFRVPMGSLKLNYLILSECGDTKYKTGNSFFGFFENKLLFLSVKKNEDIRLKIINIGKVKTGLGCLGTQGVYFPYPQKYQEVAFEVEKIKPSKDSIKSDKK